MYDEYSIDKISLEIFDRLLSEYAGIIPKKLEELDTHRYVDIPNAVKQRVKDGSCAYLTKNEVTTLVDWKLSHGKFRPTLKSLVKQNTDEFVESTTKDAFSTYTGSMDTMRPALNILTQLKGIGPATASLVLSVYSPNTAPFFSDELFRWTHFESGKGRSWDRDIKYTLKEYLEIFERVKRFQPRWKDEAGRFVNAVDMEKVAYVLGKRGAGDVDGANTSEVGKAPNGSNVGKKRKREEEVVAKTQAAISKATPIARKIEEAVSQKVKKAKTEQTAASTRPKRTTR